MIGKLRHGIQQFWSGKAQKCEKENLLTHLEAEADEIKAQFEQEYEKDLRRGPDIGLAPEKKEQLFAIILQRIAVTHGVPVVQWQQKTYRWQIAVAILLLLGLGVAVAVRNLHHGVNTEIAEAAELNYIVRQNLGVQEQEVPLPDGSKIILAPNAAVHYRHDYGQSNRAITVRIGTVTFQVAKDKTKPFVVTAARYTVTALGTVFKVHMLEKETLKVHLLEGKVVVKALKADPNVKDVYLNPGEEWQLDPRQDVKALKPLLWQQERFARFEKEAQSTYLLELVIWCYITMIHLYLP
ncbi:FecR family protein [Sphingobacterium sp. Mn56C]|uniref:FecR family protein n=1 Tax=Sphingobacterium sp. Mn56C TaxID=3395261 RepID=UPI003BDA3A47